MKRQLSFTDKGISQLNMYSFYFLKRFFIFTFSFFFVIIKFLSQTNSFVSILKYQNNYLEKRNNQTSTFFFFIYFTYRPNLVEILFSSIYKKYLLFIIHPTIQSNQATTSACFFFFNDNFFIPQFHQLTKKNR